VVLILVIYEDKQPIYEGTESAARQLEDRKEIKQKFLIKFASALTIDIS
jgi:hypothetical protein